MQFELFIEFKAYIEKGSDKSGGRERIKMNNGKEGTNVQRSHSRGCAANFSLMKRELRKKVWV